MKRKLLAYSIVLASAAVASHSALADKGKGPQTGPFGFQPIEESAYAEDYDKEAPWVLPAGFKQVLLSGEESLNIYDEGRDDWHDMNTVNETGKEAGRYLYRTHEVRNQEEGGAVSVVDLKTGETRLLAQDITWNALDGIRWTPWGTILIAEEVTGGRLFEIELDKKDRMKAAAIHYRPAVGRMAHEGIAVGNDGAIYVVDEFRGLTAGFGGGIYKFVPDTYGDLSSGQLYALAVSGGEYNTGQGEWVGPIDPLNAPQSGTEFGAASYQRPEDLEIIDNILYVAVTEGTRDESGQELFEGRVLAIDLNSLQVSNFIMPGVNVPVEIGKPGEVGHQSGWDSVDNLATTPDGKLVIIEDNSPSDIWVAGKDHDQDGMADQVWLFGSLTDYSAEGTGIYFGKDPKIMFVNIQHSQENDGDATWAIVKDQK
jgi:uncharacterized protein